MGQSLGAELFLLRTLTAFGIAGLVLAAVGAYATADHAVARPAWTAARASVISAIGEM